eukprot:GHVO01054523.1.p1 GENE.GHVO01054523.1~~GHVO01054523.1.p1  ORF type:complete len:281 (+),score=42.22 GHVO01054523.1:18-860(+)
MSRPEYIAPPDIFYDDVQAAQYTANSRVSEIQRRMTQRAVELCLIQHTPSLILDIGCGSCLSGEILSSMGHVWMGVDISESMLSVAADRDVDGDLLLADIGQPMRFKNGAFDGAISISAIQWLCNADRKEHEPYQRLKTFFTWLYACLAPGARAAFQFYPDSPQQAELITSAALRCGFRGGLIVDFPNSAKAKKHFLCIWSCTPSVPLGIQAAGGEDVEEEERISVAPRTRDVSRRSKKSDKHVTKTKGWILDKKSRQRLQGHEVRPDTKYTARKRKDKF